MKQDSARIVETIRLGASSSVREENVTAVLRTAIPGHGDSSFVWMQSNRIAVRTMTRAIAIPHSHRW